MEVICVECTHQNQFIPLYPPLVALRSIVTASSLSKQKSCCYLRKAYILIQATLKYKRNPSLIYFNMQFYLINLLENQNLNRCQSKTLDTVKKWGKQMSLGYEGDVGRASNYTGQWRPFSYSGGHRLRPPSRTLWTDPDYPSGPNPQRPVVPGHFSPKKTHFSGQRFPDTVPLNCENSPHNGDRGEKETPNPPTFLIPPHSPSSHLGKQRSPASS